MKKSGFDRIKWIILVQFLVLLYSFVSVLSKLASTTLSGGLFSLKMLLIVASMFVVMGCYAILWQKVLKHIDLSIAYSNKGVGLLWSMIWSVMLFHEQIHWNNIVGVIIIIIGIWVVNREHA